MARPLGLERPATLTCCTTDVRLCNANDMWLSVRKPCGPANHSQLFAHQVDYSCEPISDLRVPLGPTPHQFGNPCLSRPDITLTFA